MFSTNLIIGLCFFTFSYAKARYTYETKYIDVPLDHFSFFDNRTLKLRYLINDTFWKPSNGPIFFYTGNEGDIDVFAQNTGFLWETAEKFNALIVFAEHRYYGKSQPSNCSSSSSPSEPFQSHPNSNCQYYNYLSTKQALADYVDVLYSFKIYQKSDVVRRHGISKRSNPVIAFGGSYGGMLAAWMRMKYPAIVEGALASSAPILHFSGLTSCDGLNKVLTNVFNDTSPKCAQNIRNSWSILLQTLKTDNGTRWINENWNLCKPIKTQWNATQLYSVLIKIYHAIGMVNYPYECDFLVPLPANPVKEMCKYLNTSITDEKSLLSAIYKSISVYLNYNGKSKCFDWSSNVLAGMGSSAWAEQTCAEMIPSWCSNGVTDMFEPSVWNFTRYANQCYNRFGVNSNDKFLKKEYGGADLHYSSNIIFSNGLLDPWSSGGVTSSKDIPSSVLVVDIPDAAHHLDLRAKNANDPSSVERARKLYVNIFRRWIGNYRKRNTNVG